MSRRDDLRDHLHKIADMAPLTKSERTIARMIFAAGDYDDLREDAKWYGGKALSAVREIDPDFLEE